MRRETWIAGAVFAAVPVVVMSAAILCTWLIAHGASESLRVPFRILCHGIAHRCFSLWGVPMPVCARCTGIYIGMFTGLLAFVVMPWIQERVLRIAMYVAVGVLAIDGVTQLARLRESTNGLRLATGLAAGLLFGMWVLSAIERRDQRAFTVP